MRSSLMFCTAHQILFYQIKNEVGGRCSTYGVRNSCTQSFSGGNLKKTDQLYDVSVELEDTFKMKLQEVG
jgi:hypothetical protein